MLFFHNLIVCFTTLTIIFLSNLEVLVLLKILFSWMLISSHFAILSQRNVKLKIPSACFSASHSVPFTPNSPSWPLCSLHVPLRNNKPPQPIPNATMPMGPHLFSQNLFASPQTSSYSFYLWCTGITAVNPQPLPIRLLPKRLMNLYFSWNETVRPGKDTLPIHLSIQIVTKGLQGSDAPLRIWGFEMDKTRREGLPWWSP